ncbi:hypothetical protein CEXT_131971 [Caerostris extrusa]|uniref:Secreted protein n=1 Tax=Caerostris extrusa TaxID=172846 RepID=A0AAV4Y250_CAEEX|nr:hypothetical protein CEXT_131971 [Caerostris extrusa]
MLPALVFADNSTPKGSALFVVVVLAVRFEFWLPCSWSYFKWNVGGRRDIDNDIHMRNRPKKKEEKCRGATNCLAHNDFLPSSAAGFFLDLPITAIRLCMVHPSVFLEQMSAANDQMEVPPGAFPCLHLHRIKYGTVPPKTSGGLPSERLG